MRYRRPLLAASVIAVAALSLLAVARGGASSTPAATTKAQSGTLAYAQCMHSRGVPNFPDPTSSGEIPKDKIVPLVGTPQFQAAQAACQHAMPGERPRAAGTRRADANPARGRTRLRSLHARPRVHELPGPHQPG